MLNRAYSKKYTIKYPTYKNVTVCDEWHNFQTFAKWFYEESNYQDGWHLDKDLLSEDCKVYSPKTAIFMPKELNLFLATNMSNSVLPTGVIKSTTADKFIANTKDAVSGKSIYIGTFKTKEEAIEAYSKARAEQAQVWKDKMQGILPQHAIDRIK